MTIIKPIAGSPDPALVAQDLRALADLIEHDGDGFVAAFLVQLFKHHVWPAHGVDYLERGGQERAVMAEAIRRLKMIASGPVAKDYREYKGSSDSYFDATIPLQAVSIRLTDLRNLVCERVVTGVETVTEEIPDPEYIAAAPKITQTREVEQVEWQCGPIMGDAEAVQA